MLAVFPNFVGPLEARSTTASRSTKPRIASVACGLHFMNPVAADSDFRVVLLDCRSVRRFENAVELVLGFAVQDVVVADAKLVGWGHLSLPELFGRQRVHGVRIDEFRHRPGDGAIDTRPLLPSRNRGPKPRSHRSSVGSAQSTRKFPRPPAIRPSGRPWTEKSLWSYLESDHRSSVPPSGSARCPARRNHLDRDNRSRSGDSSIVRTYSHRHTSARGGGFEPPGAERTGLAIQRPTRLGDPRSPSSIGVCL